CLGHECTAHARGVGGARGSAKVARGTGAPRVVGVRHRVMRMANGPAPGRMGTPFLVVPCWRAGVECVRGPSARAVVDRNPIGGRGGGAAKRFSSTSVYPPWSAPGRPGSVGDGHGGRTTADRRLMLN